MDEERFSDLLATIFGAALMIAGLLICLCMAVLSSRSGTSLSGFGVFLIFFGIAVSVVGLIMCIYCIARR